MQILDVQNLKKEFNGEVLFSNVSFSINEKDCLAIIGPNGNGKTTLLKMILGEEEIDGGNIAISSKTSIGYLRQEVIKDITHSLYQEVEDVFIDLIEEEKKLNSLEEKISFDPSNQKLIDEYSTRLNSFIERDGYNFRYKINMMLSKFGFHKEDLNRTLSTFSGGERTKVAFVKLLLEEPNLLILDEPTNHLDLETIEWLESYLKNYNGTLILVSHDRYFIEHLANKILEIDNHTSQYYKGNYSFYLKEKEMRYQTLLNSYNNQQKEIAKLKRFIEYFKPKPRFVSRAKDREKKLEHMEIIEKPYLSNLKLKLGFEGEINKGKEMIKVEDVSIGYNSPLISNITFTLRGQDKIAIMGSNGSGKTTFLEALLDNKHILSGSISFSKDCLIGSIKQHQNDLNDSLTVYQQIDYLYSSLSSQEIYDHLGKFNFDYDDDQKLIKNLSGGERMRLSLAILLLDNYNILVLDEPTNHLDMVTRQALTKALNEFKGCLIFVSHDRYFVDEIATHVLYFTKGKAYYLEGNYQYFKEKESVLFSLDNDFEEAPSVNKIEPAKKKNNNSLKKLEEKITKIEKEIKLLEEESFKEENYTSYQKSKEIDDKIRELKSQLAILEDEYLSSI